MERPNYFDLLNLSCDAGPISKQTIEDAINNWKSRLEKQKANATSNRDAIDSELSLEGDIRKVMSDNKLRNAEAKQMKEELCGILRKLLDIVVVAQEGTPIVTHGRIVNTATKLKLSQDTVKAVYKEKGFTVIEPGKSLQLSQYFLNSTNLQTIKEKISRLPEISATVYPYKSKIKDLYDAACYFSGGSDSDVKSYHNRSTSELHDIMDSLSMKVTANTSEEGKILNDVFSQGVTKVFNSEENRRKYDMSLERDKLEPFFKLIKNAPDDFKKDEYFAEICIEKIRKSFPDYELARAIYNFEAGILKNPYEPVEPKIRLFCGSCKTLVEFRTIEEAKKAKCPACNSPIYTKCPKCKTLVPSGADYCSCGFYIPGINLADSYIKSAKQALDDMALDEARRYYSLAKNLNPEHSELSALDRRIVTEEDKFKKPLDELQKLIDSKQLCKAQEQISFILEKFPKIKLDSKRKMIIETIEQNKKRFPSENLPKYVRANKCEEILQQVADYMPALAVVRAVPPQSPKDLKCAITGDTSLKCVLTWVSSGDLGVKYMITKKLNAVPKDRTDGEIIATDLTELSFSDNSISPGVVYGYGVFACRRGAFSAPATADVYKLSDVDVKHLKTSAEEGVCKISWILPENCVGVRLIRTENIIPPMIPNSDCYCIEPKSGSMFEDSAIENNKTYCYRLQCKYMFSNGVKYSDGVTFKMSPEPLPKALKNFTYSCSNCTVTAEWKMPDGNSQNVIIREITKNTPDIKTGKIFPLSDADKLFGKGQTFANVASKSLNTSFSIPKDTFLDIAIISTGGSNGIISDIVSVSSVEPCEINKKDTKIEGDRLIIKLKSVPDLLKNIYYFINIKSSSDEPAPWVTVEQIKKNYKNPNSTERCVMSVEKYKEKLAIVSRDIPNTQIYITVIGEYITKNGESFFSKPSKQKLSNAPKKEISYNFVWPNKVFGRSRTPSLKISLNSEYTPEMRLLYRKDGLTPTKYDDKDNIVIKTFEEDEAGFVNGNLTYIFPDDVWKNLKSGTQLRLLISSESMSEFYITHPKIKNYTVP